MNGLKTGILLASLCIGSSAVFAAAATTHETGKTHKGSRYMLLEESAGSKGSVMLLLQTKNGDKIKVIVPKGEVKKLRGTRHGDNFMLWERKGTLEQNKYPYTHN